MNKNVLLKQLPEKIRELVLVNAELTELKLSHVICIANKPQEFLYFPNDGFISLIQKVDEHTSLEVGMIGREGVLGSEIILGINENLFGGIVQGSGDAWKIQVSDFLLHFQNIPELKQLIYKYLSIRIRQLGLSAACEHFHEIGPRLAKWLLMSQDRAQSSTFLMTHEFISLMLGIRRVGVTTTAAEFKRRGLIDYHRGEIKILDRTRLINEACSCYRVNKDIYTSTIKKT
jgi:CRP-like cAMP-binding protein